MKGKRKKMSVEQRAKISAAMMGVHKGKPLSVQHRLSLMKNPDDVPPGYREWLALARIGDKGLGYARVIWRRYRLTVQDVAIMYDRQAGRCLCGELLGKKWDIDHDHDTGRIRGLLHRHCNLGLLAWVERVGLDRLTTYLAA